MAATRLLAGDITVKAAGSPSLAAPPGQIVTLSWLLTNASGAPRSLREHFVLPPEWRLAPTDDAPDGAILLAPGASTLRLAALMVPSAAPAGGYLIGCNWSLADDPSGATVASGQVEVTVQNNDKLELTADKVPMMAISGEPYTVTLEAFNRGNSVLHVWAIAVTATGSPTTVSPAQFTLKPGAAMPIQVLVTPPKDLTHSITVALRGTVTANSGATASSDVFTEVYTTAATEEAPAWPSLFTTELIHDPTNGNKAAVGLEGTSRADDGSTLSYLLHSAGTNDAGFFRDPEQYSVDYRGQNVAWKAGNEIYNLSPLTTRPQFGSGGAFALAGDTSWSGGAFAMRSRESASVDNQAGAYVSYEMDNDVTLTGNVLQKTEGRLQDFAGKKDATVSAEATYSGGSDLEGQLELGASPERPEGARGSPFAERLSFDGTPGATKYSVTAENYGDAYFGALRQAQILEVSLTQALNPQFDLRTEDNYRSYSNPYSIPGEKVATNEEATEMAGVTWHPTKLLEFSLDALHADRSFDFIASPTRYIENTAEFSVRRTFEHFMLDATVDAGSLQVREGDVRRAPVERTNTSAMWHPDERHDISVFVSTGNDPYSPIAAHTVTYGGSAHAQLTPTLSATVQTGENVYDSKNAIRRSYAFGEVTYKFEDKQTVSFRVTQSGRAPGSDGKVAFSLSYTRPLNLPAPALSARCKVTGTLVDAISGEPIKRVVVVLNGRTAVTDAKGRYSFTQLKPGTYTLAVDPHSLGTDRLIVEKLPVTVHLERGQAQQVALSAEEAGKVFVQFKGADSDFPGSGAATLGGILVHMIRLEDGTTLSELTNEKGCAAFFTVRPGKWQVKVDPGYVPPRYEATVSNPVVNVSSDGTEQIEVGMKYQAPEIRWIATEGSCAPVASALLGGGRFVFLSCRLTMTKAQESPGPARSQPKIVLVEDETMIRQMLQIMLLKERGWKDVTGFGNGAEGLEYCVKNRPDLLIIDLDLPGKNGWDVAIELKRQAPKTQILILTSNDMKRKPSEFMKIGVNGYVDKTAPYPQLLQAIDVVISGALFFSADPAEDESPSGTKPVKTTDPRLVLSPEELAIARLVVAGLSSKEIAGKRNLTARSIDKHRANIMAKLGVNQAAGLVRLCVQHGIT